MKKSLFHFKQYFLFDDKHIKNIFLCSKRFFSTEFDFADFPQVEVTSLLSYAALEFPKQFSDAFK